MSCCCFRIIALFLDVVPRAGVDEVIDDKMGQSKSKKKAMESMCGKKDPKTFFKEDVLEDISVTLDLLDIDPKDAQKLFVQFVSMNKDVSGEISPEEFHDYFKLERNVFSMRAGYIDLDLSGELDFNEFIIGMYNYCTFDHFLMAKFMFDIFDVDQTPTSRGLRLTL